LQFAAVISPVSSAAGKESFSISAASYSRVTPGFLRRRGTSQLRDHALPDQNPVARAGVGLNLAQQRRQSPARIAHVG
jgi:hypothetical protein